MLTCRHCGYDLRGLPENVCPECGNAFDPNANDQPRSRGTGVVGAMLSVASAIVITTACTSLALECIQENYYVGCCRCRSGSDPETSLMLTGVVGVIAAAVGWAMAAPVPIYGRIARCATITGVVAWITCGILSGY